METIGNVTVNSISYVENFLAVSFERPFFSEFSGLDSDLMLVWQGCAGFASEPATLDIFFFFFSGCFSECLVGGQYLHLLFCPKFKTHST